MENVLSIQGLEKSFKDKQVLKGISFEVKKRRNHGYFRAKWCWEINNHS